MPRMFADEWLIALRALWPWRVALLLAIELGTVFVAVLTDMPWIWALGPALVIVGTVALMPSGSWREQRERVQARVSASEHSDDR